MQGNILKQITGTSLGPSQTAFSKPANESSLGPVKAGATGTPVYVSSSVQPNPTVFGAGTGPTYAELSFKAASSYRPPITRQPQPSLGFAGGGRVPGSAGQTTPPPIGYFEYQNYLTYFDVDVFGIEYYVRQ